MNAIVAIMADNDTVKLINEGKINRITDDLLLSRAEHNEGDLATLQEVALHQQHLMKIEYINRVSADLRQLYLQVQINT